MAAPRPRHISKPAPSRLAPVKLALGVLAAGLLAGCSGLLARHPALADGARADVAILETTDLHSNILGYDYYKLKADPTLGYERTVTLIRQARQEFPNTFLFDDGDTIQGSVLADYQALAKPVGCQEELAIYRAMDSVGYDGATLAIEDVWTHQRRVLDCDAVVAVTARLPDDALYQQLRQRAAEWADAGIRTLRCIGDAEAPGLIAHAVYAGHRYARELQEPLTGEVAFKRHFHTADAGDVHRPHR